MLEQVTLTGNHVRLDPLGIGHVAALCDVGLDEDLWRWTPQKITTAEQLRGYVETALRERNEARSLPFVIVSRADDAIAGCTRFGNIDLANRRLEIGWTWIGRAWQRTAVNTETKLLLLTHAFETLGCHRVELKTDALNERSRNAILRIGAKEEGTLRKHMVTESGRLRDTVYFSILDDEWPQVKSGLQERLGRQVMTGDNDFRFDVPGANDFDQLAALWEGAVRATHHFLAEKDVAFLRPLVRDKYLPAAQLTGVRASNGEWLAFLGVAGDELEALFVRPDAHRRGIGRRLVEYAIGTLGVTRVDVNEQNPGAVAFYERMGFEVTGRSALDGQGRPFPILHMRLRRN